LHNEQRRKGRTLKIERIAKERGRRKKKERNGRKVIKGAIRKEAERN